MSTSSSGLPLNFGYILTKPGAFKLIALGVGLFALAFTGAAFDTGTYYNKECSSVLGAYRYDRPIDKITMELDNSEFNNKQANDKVPKPKECKEVFQQTYENCILERKRLDFLRLFAKDRHKNENDIQKGYHRQGQIKPKPCPSKFMVQFPLFIIIFTWTSGFLLLPIMMFVDLNRKFSGFAKFDFIGHLMASVALGLSTLALLGFVIWLFLSNYPCSQKDYDEMYKYQKKEYLRLKAIPTTTSSWSYPKDVENPDKFAPVRLLCSLEERDSVFKIWLLLIGTVFTASTTGCYLLVTAMTWRVLKRGPLTALPVVGGGQPASMMASQIDSASAPSPNPQESVDASPSSLTGGQSQKP